MVNLERNLNFAEELLSLKKEVISNLTHLDFLHLIKIIWINRVLLFLGYATSWFIINPLSMICISLAMHNQWTIVAHHVLHGGYKNVPGVPKRYNGEFFGVGWRRWIDWFDWIYPVAWKYEHNTLHHFYTNETLDPDMIFYRVNDLFDKNFPIFVRFFLICLIMCVWKATYYSKNTLKALNEKKNYAYLKSFSEYSKQSYLYNYIPYLGFYFFVIPTLFLPLHFLVSIPYVKIFMFVLINRLGAEILTNIHSFFTIVPNHLGSDLILQPNHFATKTDFFVNQVRSTCNFNTGGFVRDYLHGYMNYQIEHHLFPDLPPSQYVKLQPKIKALCAKYGVAYKQESIFRRVKKSVYILLGIEIMSTYSQAVVSEDLTKNESMVLSENG